MAWDMDEGTRDEKGEVYVTDLSNLSASKLDQRVRMINVGGG